MTITLTRRGLFTAALLHSMSLLSATAQASGQANARARNKAASAHPRQSSGVYNAFSSKQVAGMREAFGTIDADGDGYITRDDLQTMLANLGMTSDRTAVDKYMRAALTDGTGSGQERINFTQFLTMFGEHLSELDEASDLVAAFECFDERDDGKIDAGELRYWLGEVGNRMTDAEIDRLLSGPFLDRGGHHFDYKACECSEWQESYIALALQNIWLTLSGPQVVEAVKMSEPAELE